MAARLVLVAMFLAIGFGLTARYFIKHAGGERAHITSIAVLPLQNLSRDPEQEYFADGLTDALITDLGKLGSIRVISRTSVMRYKGTSKPLPAIARELDVDSVVEGTVLRSGDRVRITTQLVRAEPEEHLWAESYERDLSDVLQLQNEVSRNIATQIQSKVSPEELPRSLETRVVKAEAYDDYLRGRYFLD
jgi:TolB-like protein